MCSREFLKNTFYGATTKEEIAQPNQGLIKSACLGGEKQEPHNRTKDS